MRHLVLDIGGVFYRALGFAAVHFRETAQAMEEIAAYFPATNESSRL
jgi:hypothetical protein